MIDLRHGDCLEILKNIESNSVNLVLIDPPYNISKDKKWDKWKTVDAYVEFMGQVFLECQRVLKDNGSFYFFHNDFLQIVELQNYINKNTDFIFKQFLVWNKRFEGGRLKGYLDGHCAVSDLRNYKQMAEYCLFYTFQDETGLKKIFSNKDCFKSLKEYAYKLRVYIGYSRTKMKNKLGHGGSQHFLEPYGPQWAFITKEVYQQLIDVFKIDEWEHFREYEDLRKEYEDLRYTFNNLKEHHSVMNYEIAKKQGHLTPKPTDLLEYIIKTSSNEGDIVLDCFAGSGSTGEACINTNRHCILIEREDKYIDIIKNRLNLEEE